MVKKYWGVRRKKRRVVVKYVRSPSFIEKQYAKVKAVNGYLYETTAGIVNRSKAKAVNASTAVSLWCVNRLLNVSKGVERLTGANQQRALQYEPKQNGNGITKINSNALNTGNENPDKNLILSRPLNQIISDTFKEEFNKIQCPARKTETIKTENQKTQKLETSIQTTHKEIISTLEEILKKSEELNKTLLGYNKFRKMKIMEGVAVNSDDQVRVMVLNYKEHRDSTLYRLKKNWVIQFRKGPNLFGKQVFLYCNYPLEGEDFKRDKYNRVTWFQDEGCNNSDDTALYANIRLKKAGSFHFYFNCENNKEGVEHDGSGFFLVDPTLTYGSNEELPLDGIQCQTVLAKSLGVFEKWESKLRVGKESGYNMIHFTPIQELGDSNSCYSLREQLKLNRVFSKERKVGFIDVEKFVDKMRKEWKVVSICDIVLNHTANESQWWVEHPEATYNCKNCPYMRPAYLLDAALYQFSLDVKSGVYEDRGVPTLISTDDHLNAIRYLLHTVVLRNIKLQEMYICDVNKLVAEFLTLARNRVPSSAIEQNRTSDELKIIQDKEYRRLASTIDMDLALHIYNTYRNDCFDEDTRIQKCVADLKNHLDSLNQEIIDELNNDLNKAVDNCIAGMRYYRIQEDGPKIKEITIKNPLIYRYFTDYGNPEDLREHEDLLYSENCKYLMAHNGWVMDSDPLRNFAADSKVYLRRELVAWGDSVKLRYGNSPEDCPFLWKHMREYVEQTVRIFDGVRLDNCHSTPIHVAEYLLDCARKIRPDLYVVAELFTNSDYTDNIFVNRLGITSLIREAMSAWDSHEQGRLVYRYGGEPVGAFYQLNTRPLVPSIAHAMFMDLTHDNPSPIEKRSVFDLLPSAALVNMACCASGSNRGYDELVPHHIHVVDETREYTEWSSKDSEDVQWVSRTSGIIQAKRAINDLHFYLGSHGFDQVYVDQIDPDIVAVTRHNPKNHQSIILVAFTAFKHPDDLSESNQRHIKPLRVEGELEEIILEASLQHKSSPNDNFIRDNRYINGCADYELKIQEHVDLKQSTIFAGGNSGDENILQLDFKDFKPGMVVAVKVKLHKKVQNSLNAVRDLISKFSRKEVDELQKIIGDLSLADLNTVLYRCDQEERDCGKGFGAYDIPNFGAMVYCGLQGIMSLLSNIRPNNDLGHPLCANLRDGNWLIDYVFGRLKAYEGTENLGLWIEKNVENLKQLPRYLIPAYFDAFVTPLYVLLLNQSYKSMSDFVSQGSGFVRGLALGSVQFGAFVKSAPLPMLSPTVKVNTEVVDGKTVNGCVSLSAGLPHFTTGYMRNWGRDTFIALRGLFILTGRFEEARYHILGYAGCLRHGLIPNLLDAGRNARYNCRDAVWWWLYCIQSYVEEVPKGESILTDMVSRIFPKDDSPALEPGIVDQPLREVMQEALNVHFQGLAFRERNAGHQIDEHMSDRGFNNQIGVHPETGFIFGGNSFNCGTWMDKMGSSDKAGNRGKPATPRDGSAVELVGLSKSVITWLVKMNAKKLYPYDSVTRKNKNGTETKWTFAEWADKIEKQFEKCYWINTEPLDGKEVKANLINKRGIYKDCYGASQDWTDFQLRCNFPIAMVAAPEMFDPEHAWIALNMAEKHLLGPLGMKTLDNSDWNYCGDYDNSNDSEDPKVSHGFNYHQGPEWVWPVGFYLRARLIFARKLGKLEETVSFVKETLSAHFTEMQTSMWRGLPELTNTDGAYCKDSSRTQAWSMSCILEVLYDLQKIESKGIMKN